MPGNRSLDEFGADSESRDGAAPAGSTRGAPEGESSQAGADAERDREEPIEPIAATFAWSAAGTECPVCGEAVQDRWRDGDDLVCEECKAW